MKIIPIIECVFLFVLFLLPSAVSFIPEPNESIQELPDPPGPQPLSDVMYLTSSDNLLFNPADYVIITSSEFYDAARQDHESGTLTNSLNRLAHWRAEYNGFNVVIVNVDHPFIGGNSDVKIKVFTDQVWMHWPNADYLLLAGGVDQVTTHYFNGCLCRAGDVWYVYEVMQEFRGDILLSGPHMYIGRFPADDQTDLDVMINKTIQYESQDQTAEWNNKVLFCEGESMIRRESSNNYPNYNFITENLKLSGWETSKVFLSEGGNATDIVNNINDGRKFVLYTGHGGERSWLHIGFKKDHIDQLTNNNMYPIVFSLCCSTGKFQSTIDCLGESFLNTPDNGAVAFYGASSTINDICNKAAKHIFESIFENFNYTLGKIIKDCKMPSPLFNLFGDPALDISGSMKHPDKPDLTISYSDIIISPEVPTHNDHEITISATIHNIGNVSSENINVSFIAHDHYDVLHIIRTKTIPSIQSGEDITITQLWNRTEQPINMNNRPFIVQIDPNDDIDEAYELNNQAGVRFIIPSDTVYVGKITNPSGPWDGTSEHPFRFIQDGIDTVNEHGTIIVYNGVYYENLEIFKSLKLVGKRSPSPLYRLHIDANGFGTAIFVLADDVCISGFVIKNSGNVGIINAGIEINGEDNVIYNNKIMNNFIGIFIFSSIDSFINNNIIEHNTYGINFNNKLHINNISENNIKENKYGIYKYEDFHTNNIIYHNNFINNIQNAWDEGHDTWYNKILQNGNYWDDMPSHPDTGYIIPPRIPGDPYVNIDYYPLEEPYTPNVYDINRDGTINMSDVSLVMQNFGCEVGMGNLFVDRCDVDGDGKVDPFDSNAVIAHFE